MGIPLEEPADRLASADGTTKRLWHRLAEFTIGDEAVDFDFAGRLARDNGWSAAFTQRAIDEYRRFLFLGQVAGHPITPSDEVDQVWHLHLTYTRSYWDDLCGDVLGAPFHHGPTKGGQAEAAKFDDWYARTLASYEEWFGTPPPAPWWPSAERRFGDAPYFVRINTKDKWLLSKPDISRAPTRVGGTVAAGLVLAGCSGGMLGLLAQAEGISIGGLAVLALLVLLLVTFIVFRLRGGGGSTGGDGDGDGGPWGGGSRDSAHWWSGDGGNGFGGGCGSTGCGGGGCGGGGCGS